MSTSCLFVAPQCPRLNGIVLSYHLNLIIPEVVSIGSTTNRLKLILAEVKFHLNPMMTSDNELSSSFWGDGSLNSGCILQILPSDVKLYLRLMCSSIEINIAEVRGRLREDRGL